MMALAQRVPQMLTTIQADMLDRARQYQKANTFQPTTYEELKTAVVNGFALAYWCGDAECEDKVKDETKATIRCIPLDQGGVGPGRCAVCGKEATERAIFARAY